MQVGGAPYLQGFIGRQHRLEVVTGLLDGAAGLLVLRDAALGVGTGLPSAAQFLYQLTHGLASVAPDLQRLAAGLCPDLIADSHRSQVLAMGKACQTT